MVKEFILLVLLILAGSAHVLYPAESSSDAPEYVRDSTVWFKAVDSYEHALHSWATPEDINAWIAAHFAYDMARAVRLSETQRAKHAQLSIYSPAEFFTIKAGVCVDLARFGVETLRRIAPQSMPQYLLIEFDPIQVTGNTLRLHWLASFTRDGNRYFFADSKRPGQIAGPHNDTRAFIDEYAQYRGRRIVAYRELESYQKPQRTQALRQQALTKRP